MKKRLPAAARVLIGTSRKDAKAQSSNRGREKRKRKRQKEEHESAKDEKAERKNGTGGNRGNGLRTTDLLRGAPCRGKPGGRLAGGKRTRSRYRPRTDGGTRVSRWKSSKSAGCLVPGPGYRCCPCRSGTSPS